MTNKLEQGVIEVSAYELGKRLQQFTDEGYELISAVEHPRHNGNLLLFFKRFAPPLAMLEVTPLDERVKGSITRLLREAAEDAS